jgi:hypothetical protein
MAGFWNNFYGHRRLYTRISESRNKLPADGYHAEILLQLITDFIEESCGAPGLLFLCFDLAQLTGEKSRP